MEIQLKTLTPLWTGGVDGSCDRLHETGIIGSLRWWYEAIVRGLGGYACDPTGEERCTYDNEKGPESVCHACQLFGCTSLSRGFRIQLDGFSSIPLGFITTLSKSVHGKRLPNNAWWLGKILKKPGYSMDQLTAEFVNNHQEARLVLIPKRQRLDKLQWEAQIQYLLKWIELNAGLGRKIQNGFGQVRTDTDSRAAEKGKQAVKEFLKRPARLLNNEAKALPSTSSFFKMEFQIGKSDPQVEWLMQYGQWVGRQESALCPSRFIPCAYDIRYAMQLRDGKDLSGLRWKLKTTKNTEIARELFGAMGFASRINVSHLIAEDEQYRLRIFGFVDTQQRNFIVEHVGTTVKELFPTSKEIMV